MEEFAVVLADGAVVLNRVMVNGEVNYLTNFDYTNSGKVRRFFYKNMAYIALFYSENNDDFAVYFNEVEFNARKVNGKISPSKYPNSRFKPEWFIQATTVSSVNIKVERMYIKNEDTSTHTDDGLCKAVYQFPYIPTVHIFNQGTTIPIPSDHNYSGDSCLSLTDPLYKFYNIYASNPTIDKKVLLDIAYMLERYRSTDSEFMQYLISINMVNTWNYQEDHWSDQQSFEDYAGYTNEDFINYKNWLERYYFMFKYYQEKINQINNDADKMFIAASFFDAAALRYLDVSDKVKILTVIAKGSITDTFSYLFQGGSREELVLRVIKAVRPEEATQFLDKITQDKFLDQEGKDWEKTIFQVIYEKVHDKGFGEENCKKVMEAFYLIWLNSVYNPYDSTGEALKPEFTETYPFSYNNKSVTIDYQSEKLAYVFEDTNHDFAFNFKSIRVYRDSEYLTDELSGLPGDLIGDYGIFQAVSVVSSGSNGINIRFPLINVNGKRSSAIPIFYLKYIDDAKQAQNIETGIEIAFDIGVTLTGVGNLSKLRHLKSLNKLGRVALGLEAAIPGQALVAYELAQGVAGVIEVSGSVASMWLNHVIQYNNLYCNSSDPADIEKCEWYTMFDNWMLFLQLKSGLIDAASSLAVRKGARKLLSSPIPNDFESEALEIVARFADQNFTDLKQLFGLKLSATFGTNNSAIWQKLNNLPITKQEDFLFDFQHASKSVLQELNSNAGSLVDTWTAIVRYPAKGSDINYLKILNRIENIQVNNNETLLDHVTLGGKRRNNNIMSGGHMPSEIDGVNLRLGNGSTDLSILPTNSYGVMLVDQTTGIEKWRELQTGGGRWMPKRITPAEPHTLFPIDWTRQDIKEEFATALMNSNRRSLGNRNSGFIAVSESGVEIGWFVDPITNEISTFFPIF